MEDISKEVIEELNKISANLKKISIKEAEDEDKFNKQIDKIDDLINYIENNL